ncbi:DUF1631 family protein [Gilvimarinus xylanilyticus]|uniref:DUF1631 domain-containing protein n=1 Tax=Gilvimarinus xylanilyticus TaxID=2944139 RepID=A0A9X2I376_9GAMM|nr:DUF1631 family protein [Gilvimarinus xylanilyticus]MCP8899495.1 DUF1631 domain-containing protein [Gilvimarinus xylanilyticus]
MSTETSSGSGFARLAKLLNAAPSSSTELSALKALPTEVLHSDDPWRGYRAQLGENASLPGLYAAWFAQALRDNIDCDESLRETVERLSDWLLHTILGDESLQLHALRANRRHWDQAFFHLHTWCDELGPQGRKFTQRIDELVEQLEACTGPEGQTPRLEAFNHAGNRELERAAKLAERMQASEVGRMRALHAEQQVNALYNQVVAGRDLPESVWVFIDQQLMPALQFVLINESDQAPAWSFWTRMLRLLVWSLNPDKSAEDRQAFFNKGPALLTQLEQAEPPPSCAASSYQAFLSDVSECVITLLKGQSFEVQTAPSRDTHQQGSLEQLHTGGEAHPFSGGDWIEFCGDQVLRCQFLLQAPGTDQLLFVNRNGQKVLQKSVADMRACFDADIAREIANVPVLSAAITATNARMAQLQTLYEQRAAAAAEAREQEQLRRRALAEAHARDLAARKEAEAKARQEAERLAAQRRERLEREKREQAAAESAAHEKQVRQTLDNLTLGTWADLPLDNGRTARCKLAVSMRSTGKYIFVDRVGSKVAELQYEQLLTMALAGTAVFYQPEQHFENRLESIVRGLRRTD